MRGTRTISVDSLMVPSSDVRAISVRENPSKKITALAYLILPFLTVCLQLRITPFHIGFVTLSESTFMEVRKTLRHQQAGGARLSQFYALNLYVITFGCSKQRTKSLEDKLAQDAA